MIIPTTYCNAIKSMKAEDKILHRLYHDNHYGFPIE